MSGRMLYHRDNLRNFRNNKVFTKHVCLGNMYSGNEHLNKLKRLCSFLGNQK